MLKKISNELTTIPEADEEGSGTILNSEVQSRPEFLMTN